MLNWPLIYLFCSLKHCVWTVGRVLGELRILIVLALRPRTALIAENLFLRKQLALFKERNERPRRADNATRWLLAALSALFDWRSALVVVKPDTLIRWHRNGFRMFWRWKSKPKGRPKLPRNISELVNTMAAENPSWGQRRIANELKVKLGVCVSPRTVQKYLSTNGPPRTPDHKQRWQTFVRNHADVLVACDFFTVVTARFRILYVFVVMELGSRRLVHHNVTAHPTAEWTIQQFRETLPGEHPYRYLIHDRDSIFSQDVDTAAAAMGVKILRTPYRSPQANGRCERLIGTIRRECLNFFIPWNERHLKAILNAWAAHYNRGRPHMALGPGIPETKGVAIIDSQNRHSLSSTHRVQSKAVLGGLHHEYTLEKVA